jgi:hypothetical protein
MNNELEVWVPIFRSYEISNLGRVKSNKREVPIILKTYRQNRDYHIVHLRIAGKRKALTIHRLVALIFLKNTDPLKTTVNHHNGKDDNRACSLSWMTYSENSQHGADNDLLMRGSRHHMTSLDESQVRTIKSLNGELKSKVIGKYFDISRQNVEDIWHGYTWKHIAA